MALRMVPLSLAPYWRTNQIEINIYPTGKIKDDKKNNIIVRSFFTSFLNTMGLIVFCFHFLFFKVLGIGAEKDATTFLRAPTH